MDRRDFLKPLSSAEVASLLERTKPAVQEGKCELYKTSAHFDRTAHKPQVLVCVYRSF